MGTLIKNNDEDIKQKIETLGVDWLAGNEKKMNFSGKRIIKANQLPKNKRTKREIPITEKICDQPEVKVIGTPEQIEGLEIICNCGQKMIVHFNYDENE